MKPQIELLVLTAICLSGVALAQSAQVNSLPSCASECLDQVLKTGICSATDLICHCTNSDFLTMAAICRAKSCSFPDQLVSQNATATMCHWPIRDRSATYAAVSNTMIVIAAVCVLLRLLHKIITKIPVGLDDWLILATLCISIASAVITVKGTIAYGLGKDIWTLSPHQITTMLKFFYWMFWMYFTEVTLLKLSIIGFYLRIFPSRGVQQVLWGTFAVTAMWGIATTLATAFQCRPVSFFWTQVDGVHQGKCIDAQGISVSNAAINVILDLWVLGIPLWQLRGLQLHWKKKVGVAFMFCIGLLVTIVSILRLHAILNLRGDNNPSYSQYYNSLWSTLEVSIGIICACLPAVRLILIRVFPILGGSSARSRVNRYYHDGADMRNHSSVGGTNRTSQRVANGVMVTSEDSGGEIGTGGIRLEKTYDVQFGDQAQLIEMRVLNTKNNAVN